MRSGSLRHRVEVQEPTVATTAYGESSRTWATRWTRWANVTPLRGREFADEQNVRSELSHKVVMRWESVLSEMTTKYQILFGSRVFAIESIANVGERDRMVELLCKEEGV